MGINPSLSHTGEIAGGDHWENFPTGKRAYNVHILLENGPTYFATIIGMICFVSMNLFVVKPQS